MPHSTTLVKLVRCAGPQVVEQLNQALLTKLAQDKLLRGRKLRVDTTVVEADIDHPTDADLLEQAVRKLGGWCGGSRTEGWLPAPGSGTAPGRRGDDSSRSPGPCGGGPGRQAQAEVDRLTAEVTAIARRSLTQAERVVRAARRARRAQPADGRLGRLAERLEETTRMTRRLLDQTDQRLSGNRVIGDRLVSLSDPDARPIRKGNPPDAAQLVGAVTDVIALTGRPPGTVVGDRGFGTAAHDAALVELGVTRIGLARTGTPGKARLGIFAYNLQRMTVVAG